MGRKKKAPEIIIIEQEGSSGIGWLLFGAAVGAGAALLLAPASGEETRKALRRRAAELQRSAEDAIDGLREQFDALTSSDEDEQAEDGTDESEGDEEEGEDEGLDTEAEAEPETLSDARAELERRLAAARARRRVREPDEAEPVA